MFDLLKHPVPAPPVVYKDYVNLLYLYYHVFTSDFLFQLYDATITAARRSKFRLAPFCPTRVSRMVTKTNGFRNLPESRRLSVRSNPSLVVRHGGVRCDWGRALRAVTYGQTVFCPSHHH